MGISYEEALAQVVATDQFVIGDAVINGAQRRVFVNAPPNLGALFQAAPGDAPFIVYEGETYTFDDVRASFAALGAVLVHSYGVRKGDRVAIAMRNLPEWPVAFFGCLLAGGVATLLNAWWTGPELEYGLVDSGAKVAIVDRERLGRLAEHLHNCPELKRVLVTRGAVKHLEEALA